MNKNQARLLVIKLISNYFKDAIGYYPQISFHNPKEGHLGMSLFGKMGMCHCISIDERLLNNKLKELFKKIVLHELAHVFTEYYYQGSNHNDKFKSCCLFFGIEYFEKVTLTEEEKEILNGK